MRPAESLRARRAPTWGCRAPTGGVAGHAASPLRGSLRQWAVLVLATLGVAGVPGFAATEMGRIGRVCTLISESAGRHGLPESYLARLIWKESSFDAKAVSPAGAEGIAQFMPSTASRRGLDDPFDPEQAISAAAAYLADMRRTYGNLGLAAIGYNAGEDRLSRWLSQGGFLPLETEDYVLSVTGKPVEHFIKRGNEVEDRPLDARLPFEKACRRLPVIESATVPMSRQPRLPWAVQVAGSPERSAAIARWHRLRRQFSSVLAGHTPFIQRKRSPLGRSDIYAVRLGAQSRAEADRLCARLTRAGGSCLVMKD